MGDGYFYTLSAIAQSFAAIVALNAVFVIYKLQLLKNESVELIKKLRKIYIQNSSPEPGSGRIFASDRVDRMTDEEVLSFAKGFTGGRSDLVNKNKETLRLHKINAQFSKDITKWFKRTLLFNGSTVLLGLILLPWKNLLPNSVRYIILGIVLLLAVLALLLTIHAILFTLESGGISVIRRIFVKKAER